jgi:hypothetical protein
MKYLKLFESFEQTIFELRDVRVIMHINGITKLWVEKDPSINIYNTTTQGRHCIVTFKQTDLDEFKPILEPLGYKINPSITGCPFENKQENKMLFIHDIGDYWYILSFYNVRAVPSAVQTAQLHFLIDEKINLIEKIKELTSDEIY